MGVFRTLGEDTLETMVKYSREPQDMSKCCKARGNNLRVHYKNSRETANAVKGMTIKKAQKFLQDVIAHKDIVPFRRHTGGIGHAAQAKNHKVAAGRWPEKSCRYVLDLLTNAEANAEIQGLEADSLVIQHVQVNRAPGMRRRTYRAHGRINPYMCSPCHIEFVLAPNPDVVKKGDQTKKVPRKRGDAKLEAGSSGF